MPNMDERTLIADARRGDRDALAALLEPLHGQLWGYLVRFTRNPHDAEDLLQETYVRVIGKIGTFRPRGSFRSWVFTIAAHLAVDHARGQQRHTFEPGSFEIEAPSAERPDRRLAARETRDRVRGALDELHPAQRAVFLLRTEAELPFREIARVLGCPLGTALGRMHDATRRLRTLLADAAPGREECR